ncbi:DUF3850 domain-containing protein [Proteus mirabilis]|uniref:DUF3850 domain-containing protein n=1 Tax=Proteus mirabilis TaxID=584 RepID=UPI001FAD1063|nr:DUF3850 domain-containing protein [Proteus mirabilis]MCI9729804.1 DUF3850 domain-containing protein [Proteus mirabilis]MCI9733567.1 DUF3850 domain-containing protein [Proteus mirabilis]MCI9737321.1 DUF3850 domain-containing protein [Proteus mirabilis]MCI9758104.1 DUF3850 domain-containing protein [Proteus mirabilis]MCI9761880.1 DUF3850 domain-containing protein [Proteus mirabilis]
MGVVSKESKPIHYLKIKKEYFESVLNGSKKAEFRKESIHKKFQVGNTLVLKEVVVSPMEYQAEEFLSVEIDYTGREIWCEITNVTIINDVYPELEKLPELYYMISFSIKEKMV